VGWKGDGRRRISRAAGGEEGSVVRKDFVKGIILKVIILIKLNSMKDCVVEMLDGVVAGDCPCKSAYSREVLLNSEASEALCRPFTVGGTNYVGRYYNSECGRVWRYSGGATH